MNKIGIIDYGMGNIGSILNSLKFINMKSDFITMPNQIKNYGTLILPGVGAFEKAMKNLENSFFNIETRKNHIIKNMLFEQLWEIEEQVDAEVNANVQEYMLEELKSAI